MKPSRNKTKMLLKARLVNFQTMRIMERKELFWGKKKKSWKSAGGEKREKADFF